MLYCQGIWVAERRSKEPNQDDLRQVSGTKPSQHGLTSGLSSLAASSLPQSPLSARHRQRLSDKRWGSQGVGDLTLKQRMVLEQRRTTRFPQSLATSLNALVIANYCSHLRRTCRNSAPHRSNLTCVCGAHLTKLAQSVSSGRTEAAAPVWELRYMKR